MGSVHLGLLLWVLLLVQVDAESEVDILAAWQMNIVNGAEADLSVVKRQDYFSTWNSSEPNPCGWVGVTCTANFTVEELDLSGWGLTYWEPLGMLQGLKDLRHLDLSFSNLDPGGFFPENVALLNGLTYLDLSNSRVPDAIPERLSNLTMLRYLSLEQNQLSGAIPNLPGLVNLEVLLLGGNNLTGPFPEYLSGLDSLVRIDLSDNQLEGAIPYLLSFPELVNLKLDNNNFTEFTESGEPQFSNTNPLQRLFVSGNQLGGMIPTYITSLLNLTFVDMSGNQLVGIPSGFSGLWNNSLAYVDLSHNNLSGSIPADFLAYRRAYNSYVNLSHNLLSGNLSSNVSLIQPSTSFVDLSYNQLTGPLPSTLTPYYGANSLWLGNNQFSGDIVDVLLQASSQSCGASVELHLDSNRLTGDLSRMIGKWGNLCLAVLDLSNNYLQMTVTATISDPLAATLQDFAENFTLEVVANAGAVEIQLHLAGNNFSGTPLPTRCFANSSRGNYFEAIDLSNNSLQGEISGEVFSGTCLQQLKSLNLSNNDLTGPVPESLVMLPNLVALDVSSNDLSGPLPDIPFSSPFNERRTFANNPGLCGDPLARCEPPRPTGVPWWVVLIITLVSIMSLVGSCLVTTWRWKVYQQRHQQDADLIKTLLERESAALMPLQELKKATDNFAEGAQIGEGGFGKVYTGKLSDGTVVAIKRSKREGSEGDKQQFLNEVRILSQVNHRFLVKLLGCCMENKIALLVFEFVSNGTLEDHLHGKTRATELSWKQRLDIAVQTADALNYLHSATTFPIYHRDVKSANILLDNEFNAKLADFGISKLAPVRATHVSTVAVQGTMGYIDPEYYTSFQLTDKSDVYSFGVVLLELISAKPVIDFARGADETSLVSFASPHIRRGDLEQLIDPALMETYLDKACCGKDSMLNLAMLAMKCLDMRSKGRPSMNEVWRELQNLCQEFHGIFENSDSINEPESEARHHHRVSLLSESFNRDSASLSIEDDTRSIQMAQRPSRQNQQDFS